MKIFLLFILFIANGLAQDESVKEFHINPNPTSGIVNIDIRFSDPNGGAYIVHSNIEVYNSVGELILNRAIKIIGGGYGVISDTFYLTNCSSGIYFIKISALGYLFVSRLLLIK
jgi:hypothetical protein